jgi:membrane-associated phospholipid phosphatase
LRVIHGIVDLPGQTNEAAQITRGFNRGDFEWHESMYLPETGTDQSDRRRRKMTATTVLAAYLAASALAAAAGAAAGRTPATVLAVHLAALCAILWIATRRVESLMTDWLPIIAVPFLYAELPAIHVGPLHDAVVQRWESDWFGASPAHVAAVRWPSHALSELLHAAYLSYYAIIVVPPLVLYLKGDRARFGRVTAGLIAIFALCFAMFIVFPVAGPRYEWSAPPGVYDGPIRRFVLQVLEAGSSKGTAFPSSHVAVAAAQSVITLGWSRRFGVGLSIVTLLLAAGAVYGGFHYAVDAVAGGLIGCAVGTVFSFAHRDESVGAEVAAVDLSLATE